MVFGLLFLLVLAANVHFMFAAMTWGYIDLDMLIHEKDRSKFEQSSMKFAECQKGLWRNATVLVMNQDNLPRFRVSLGNQRRDFSPHESPPFPPSLKGFMVRLNFDEDRFTLEIPTWYFVNTIDLTSCSPSLLANSTNPFYLKFKNKIVLKKCSNVSTGVHVGALSPAIYQNLASLISTTLHNDSNYFLGNVPLMRHCPGRLTDKPGVFPDQPSSQGKLIEFELAPYSDDKSLYLLHLSKLDIFNLPSNENEFLAENPCFNTSLCAPYLLYGPEFTPHQQCSISCRPMNITQRHREDKCRPPGRKSKPRSIGINCRLVDVNKDTKMAKVDQSNLFLHVYETIQSWAVKIRCRIPNDRQWLLKICSKKAICDPTLDVLLDGNLLHTFPNISKTLLQFNVTNPPPPIPGAGPTVDQFTVIWDAKDDRFFDIGISIGVAAKNQNYSFSLKFNDKTKAKNYLQQTIAEVGIYVKELKDSKPPADLDEQFSRYTEHYVEINEENFQLTCIHSNESKFMTFMWFKQEKGAFVQKIDSPLMQEKFFGHHPTVFIAGTKCKDKTCNILLFDRYEEAYAGFYGCSYEDNSGNVVWHYHVVRNLRPLRCSAHQYGDNQLIELQAASPHPGILVYGASVTTHEFICNRSLLGFKISCEFLCPAKSICGGSQLCRHVQFVFTDHYKRAGEFRGHLCEPNQLDEPQKTILTVPDELAKYNTTISLGFIFFGNLNDLNFLNAEFMKRYFPIFTLSEAPKPSLRQRVCGVTSGNYPSIERKDYGYDECNVRFENTLPSWSNVLWAFSPSNLINFSVIFECNLWRRWKPIVDSGGKILDPEVWLHYKPMSLKVHVKNITKRISDTVALTNFSRAIVRKTGDFSLQLTLEFFSTYYHDSYGDEEIQDLVAGYYNPTFAHGNLANTSRYADNIEQFALNFLNRQIRDIQWNCHRSLYGAEEYVGTLSKTTCGSQCLNWSSYKIPGGRASWTQYEMPESLDTNYCRNPGRQSPYGHFCPILAQGKVSTGRCLVPLCSEVNDEIFLRNEFKKADYRCLCAETVSTIDYEISAGECGKICLTMGAKCSTFNHQTSTGQCEICKGFCKMGTCQELTDWHTYLKWSAKEKPKPQPFPRPQLPDLMNYYHFYIFEEGAPNVFIPCHHLWSPKTYRCDHLANSSNYWQYFHHGTQRFENITRSWYDESKRLGLYGFSLQLGEQRISISEAGVYRCVSGQQVFEYHNVAVYKPLRCLIYINGTLLKASGSHYNFVFSFGKSGRYVIDLLCALGNRPYTTNATGLVDPDIYITVDGKVWKKRQVRLYSIFPRTLRTTVDITRVNKNASIYFTFTPRPVVNVFQLQLDLSIPANISLSSKYNPANILEMPRAIMCPGLWFDIWLNYRKPQVFYDDSIDSIKSNVRIEMNLHPQIPLAIQIPFVFTPEFRTSGRFCTVNDTDTNFCSLPEVEVTMKRPRATLLITEFDSWDMNAGEVYTDRWETYKFSLSLISTGLFRIDLNYTATEPNEGTIPPDFDTVQDLSPAIFEFVVRAPNFFGYSKSYVLSLDIKFSSTRFAQIGLSETPYNRDCFWKIDGTDYVGIEVRSFTFCPFETTLCQYPHHFCRGIPYHPPGTPVTRQGAIVLPDVSSPSCMNKKQQIVPCDIPMCLDYSFRFDRYMGQCSGHVCPNVKEITSKPFSECQTQCEESEQCVGFNYQINKCVLHLDASCACDMHPKRRNCSSFVDGDGFYFRKRSWSSVISNPEIIYNMHVIMPGSVRVSIPITASLTADADRELAFISTSNMASVVKPVNFADVLLGDGGRYFLTFKKEVRISNEHEGVYMIKEQGKPKLYIALNLQRTPKCQMFVDNTAAAIDMPSDQLNFELGKVYLSAHYHNPSALRFVCHLHDGGKFASCPFENSMCNPRLGLVNFTNVRYKEFVFKSWHEEGYSNLVYDVSLELENGGHSFSLNLTFKEPANIEKLLFYFHFYPTAQEWPISKLELIDDDDPGMIWPYAINGNWSQNWNLILFLLTMHCSLFMF